MTTNLNVVRTSPEQFVWGEIVKFQDIGEYTVAEFVDEETNQTLFWGWVSGQDFSQSWDSLDEALVGLIALKHDDRKAGGYFFKMIGA